MSNKKLNPLGSFLRKYRVDKNETMGDMANKLGFSKAYLSSIETGKRNVSEKLISKFRQVYKEDKNFYLDLEKAIDDSKTIIRFKKENLIEAQFNFLKFFKNNIGEITKEKISKLIKICESK